MLPALAGFGRLAPMGGHRGQEGVNIKNPLKKGMCCASGPKYRNSVCFGVDKKECESL